MVPHNNFIPLVEGATILDIAEERKQDVHIRWNESSGEELRRHIERVKKIAEGATMLEIMGEGELESKFGGELKRGE